MYQFLTSLHVCTCIVNKTTPQPGQVNPMLLNNNWNNIVVHDDCSPKEKIAHFGVGEDALSCKNPICEVMGTLSLEYLRLTLPAPGRKCSRTLQDDGFEQRNPLYTGDNKQ